MVDGENVDGTRVVCDDDDTDDGGEKEDSGVTTNDNNARMVKLAATAYR